MLPRSGGQFGAHPPEDSGCAAVHAERQVIQDVGVVAVVADGWRSCPA